MFFASGASAETPSSRRNSASVNLPLRSLSAQIARSMLAICVLSGASGAHCNTTLENVTVAAYILGVGGVDPRYGVEELASLGGVSRRTIRYYVHEGLLPEPLGVGSGRDHGDPHLHALLSPPPSRPATRRRWTAWVSGAHPRRP